MLRSRKFCMLWGVLLLAAWICGPAHLVNAAAPQAASQEETIVGIVAKAEKGYIIEAEDGDYLVKGQDVSKMLGKMIEATGIITETEKGDFIEVKSFEEIQE